MNVDTTYSTVGKFYGHNPLFRVPKYQRSYAWGKAEIEDFLRDLENCYNARKKTIAGTNNNHFLGCIVSVSKPISGAVNQIEYELVDGQQRMATFVLLMAALISEYLLLLKRNLDTNTQKDINDIINNLKSRFIDFDQEVNRKHQIFDVLTLSKADEMFFKELVHLKKPDPVRESHFRLQYAFDEIKKRISRLSLKGEAISNLEVVQQIIENDFSLIHIVTGDKREAYKLFQVLNDRGTSLTEGDLLRAKTLELLEGFANQQNSVESFWDDILADSPKKTEDFLMWIYASNVGKRAESKDLFDDFLDKFYPQHQQIPLNSNAANSIEKKTKDLLLEIKTCRLIFDGSWPYDKSKVTQWDRNRLTLLIKELTLTITMPLLIAARLLPENRFSEIVQILERFLFRFKIVCNQHISPVTKIIHDESVEIRKSPDKYRIQSLKNKLQNLINTKANDSLFKGSLDSLTYKDGGGNKPLKYFLMTLEHYRRWYIEGKRGNPKCRDKTRIYDFSSTTIEHIYSKKTISTDIQLEPVKHMYANLTFLGSEDNITGANELFGIKRKIYAPSSVGLNQDIAKYRQWTIKEFHLRDLLFKDMASAIFKP